MTAEAATPVPLLPASGAWQEGDPPGRRQWVVLAEPLEAGGELPGVRLAYESVLGHCRFIGGG